MNNRHRGGILLTTLLLVFLFSFIFTLVLEDFQLTQRFTQKTKDYYIAKTMVSMFLSDVKQAQQVPVKKGQQSFSAGILYYEYDRTTFRFTVKLKQTMYRFEEEYQEVKKDEKETKKERTD